MSMKIFIITFFLVHSVFANESFTDQQVTSYFVAKKLVATGLKKNSIDVFRLKDVLHNQDQFNQLIANTLQALELESVGQAQELLDMAAKQLPVENHIRRNPIYAQFLMGIVKAPQAVGSLLQIFFQKSKIVFFFFILVGSLVLSHFMGELKYFMAVMSPLRVSYSCFRFAFINGLRLGAFIYLFSAQLKPIGSVYLKSINLVSEHYPQLTKLSNFIAHSLDKLVV